MKFILLICLFLITSNSFSAKFDDVRKYCPKKRCTDVIKTINVGQFYFKARNCETKDYRKCQIWFGTAKNRYKEGWVKNYRIINGPLPLKLKCFKGQLVWFQDLPFPKASSKNDDVLKTLEKLSLQNKEKIYFKRSANEHFNFFSSRDKSFGILINKKDKKGFMKNVIYIFNIENEKMKKIYNKCN